MKCAQRVTLKNEGEKAPSYNRNSICFQWGRPLFYYFTLLEIFVKEGGKQTLG